MDSSQVCRKEHYWCVKMAREREMIYISKEERTNFLRKRSKTTVWNHLSS
jgi:hypothetical protein